MAFEFKLPDLGEGLTEGEVVPVGKVIVVIGGDGRANAEAPSKPSAQRAPEARNRPVPDSERVRTTPLVRRVAKELGVDLSGIAPSGPGGRITEDDVRGAAGGTSSGPGQASEERREPLRGVRRVIAEHMTRAQSIPAVTWVEECDFGNVDVQRLVPTVLKAVAASLREFPELNARLEGDEIVFLERYDLGVAIDTDEGLVVPVVRDCDSLSLDELEAEVSRLAESARAGTLKPDELRGSTFTVTSAGKFSGAFVTPLINHPEVAILGVHRIAERPVVRDGKIVARPIGHVSVTFDHRVLDGATAAEFTRSLRRNLEEG